MNPTLVLFLAGLALATSSEILQGPSFRHINAGPDGSLIDSFAVGGAVVNGPSPILAAPALKTFVGHAAPYAAIPAPVALPAVRTYAHHVATPYVAEPYVAAPYHHEAAALIPPFPFPFRSLNYGYTYGLDKTVVAGPSGTIVADKY